MDDDFGDFAGFGGFSSAQGTSKTATDTAIVPPIAAGTNTGVFSFDSLQGAPGVDVENGFQEFPDFSQFGIVGGSGGDSVHTVGGVMFDIPPLPFSPDPDNVHVVGGVQFEFPPLPDFSPEELEAGAGAVPLVSNPETTMYTSKETNSASEKADGEVSGLQGVTDRSSASKQANNTSHLASNVTDSLVHSDQPLVEANTTGVSGGRKDQSDVAHEKNNTNMSLSDSFGDFSSSGNPVANGNGSYGAFSGFQETVAAPSSDLDDDFGRFSEGMESFPMVAEGLLTTTPSGNPSDTTGMATVSTIGGSVNPATGDNSLGGFPAISAAGGGGGGNEFGGFSSISASVEVPTPGGFSFDTFSNNQAETEGANEGANDDFGGFTFGGANFAAFSSTAESKGGGEFGVLSFGPTSAGNSGGPTATTDFRKIEGDNDKFGGFASASGADFARGDDEFGGFSSAGGADFGAFPSKVAKVEGGGGEFGEFSSGPTTAAVGDDDFGGFADAPARTEGGSDGFSSSTSATAGGDFGGFAGADTSTGDDKFGGFSGFAGSVETSTGQWARKESSGSLGLPSTPAATSSVGHAPPQLSTGKSAVDTLGMCFTGVAGLPETPSPSLIPLAECVKEGETTSEPAGNTSQGLKNNPRLWCSLLNCLNLAVPLHKFDKSFLQERYYSNALSVDPLLVSRPSTLSVLTGMTRFEAPLGGATAMEDLRESFGFEGDLAQPGSPTEPITSPFRRQAEEGGAALLDLSFPLSPNSPTRDSFTLTADLAGLDLNPEPKQEKQLTSIQELLLNERLVVNRSTWMDSQLAELGEGGGTVEDTTPTSQPNTPRSARNTMESQLELLGLDVSKTTSVKTSNKELSLSARSVLGRLPDLSFMSLRNKMEKRTLYFSGSS